MWNKGQGVRWRALWNRRQGEALKRGGHVTSWSCLERKLHWPLRWIKLPGHEPLRGTIFTCQVNGCWNIGGLPDMCREALQKLGLSWLLINQSQHHLVLLKDFFPSGKLVVKLDMMENTGGKQRMSDFCREVACRKWWRHSDIWKY